MAGRRTRALAAALSLLTVAGAAHAHAPVPRRVALPPDASAIALSLPGFGLIYRSHPDQPFTYVCDALLGLKPSELVPALSFLNDGSLLLGSADGVRRVARDGCPRAEVTGELASAPVVALAVREGARESAYAVARGNAAGLWQSDDGGKRWQLRSRLEESEQTSALVLSKREPERIYVSVRAAAGPIVLASSDGGSTWQKHTQELPLVLLSADGSASYPLWAMARDALTVGNRGIAILRARDPAGPWSTALRVNYFGGFVIDAQGVIWVGDEIGGLYRSDDGGDSFRNLESDADIGCLAAAGGALWACTPGTLAEPALQRISPGQPRSPLASLNAVDQLPSCPDLEVTRSCAAAWAEWQRDVQQLLAVSQDAGQAVADAGAQDAQAAPDVPAQSDAGAPTQIVANDGGDSADAAPLRAGELPAACALGPTPSLPGTARFPAFAALSGSFAWVLGRRRRTRRVNGTRGRDEPR